MSSNGTKSEWGVHKFLKKSDIIYGRSLRVLKLSTYSAVGPYPDNSMIHDVKNGQGPRW